MARFNLLVDLNAFTAEARAGVNVSVSPTRNPWPEPGVAVHVGSSSAETDADGEALFDLLAGPDLGYVVQWGGVYRFTISADQTGTVRLDEIADAPLPAPVGAGLQAQISGLIERVDELEENGIPGVGGPVAIGDVAGLQGALDGLDASLDSLAQQMGGVDHGALSGSLTISSDDGAHVLSADGPLAVSLAADPNFRVLALTIDEGAEDVTVTGLDLTFEDGQTLVFQRLRGTWRLMSSAPAVDPEPTEDTTPPSAITDLAADPGDDGTTATLTWSAATDAESTVKYRARVYPTGDTPPAWPTSGPLYGLTSTTVEVTGLSVSEDHTAEVHAYSSGGASASDSTTFTTPTPAGWSVFVDDDFTGTAGAAWDGRTPDTIGSSTWTKGIGWASQHNTNLPPFVTTGAGAMKPANIDQGENTEFWQPVTGAAAGFEVSATLTLATQANSNASAAQIGFGMGGPDLYLKLAQTGTLLVEAGGGSATPTITGSMAGGASGKMTLRFVARAVTVLWNDVVVGTGTTAWDLTPRFASFQATNMGNSSIQRFTARRYA